MQSVIDKLLLVQVCIDLVTVYIHIHTDIMIVRHSTSDAYYHINKPTHQLVTV